MKNPAGYTEAQIEQIITVMCPECGAMRMRRCFDRDGITGEYLTNTEAHGFHVGRLKISGHLVRR